MCDAKSGGNLLSFERANYSATTGAIELWVRTTLTSASDTTVFVFLGKAGDTGEACNDTSYANCQSIAPIAQMTRTQERDGARRFFYSLFGVTFSLRGAEKVAADIAFNKTGAEVLTAAQEKHMMLRKAVTDALRKGDSQPLEDAIASGAIPRAEVRDIREKARLDPLVARIKDFTYPEIMRVYEAADPRQRAKLDALLRTKRSESLSHAWK